MNSNARAQFYRLRSQLLASVIRPEVWQVRLPGAKAWMQWVEDDTRIGWDIRQDGSAESEFIEGPRDVTASIVVTRLISKSFDEHQLASLEAKSAALIRDASAQGARDLLIRRLQASVGRRIGAGVSGEQLVLLEELMRELCELATLDPLQEPQFDSTSGATSDAPERS